MKNNDIMKRIKYLAVSALMLTTVGCSDFLELNPLSNANENGFYNTSEDIKTSLVSAYATLYDIYDPEGLPSFYGELMSDNVYSDNTAGTVTDYEAFDTHIGMTTSNSLVEGYWETYYNAIFIINKIIEKASPLGDDAAQYAAEAKFLRALYYFDMVWAWGDVPLVLTPISISESYSIARTPSATVYEQIIKDLKDASDLLPSKDNERFAGAATSDAANTLLGKVYLTLGDKTNAAVYLNKVYGKFRLEKNYADLWSLNNKNCEESIFEVQYTATTSSSQPYSKYWSMFTPVDNRIVTAWGAGINQVSDDLWNAYEEGDPRRDASIADGYYSSNGDFVPTRYSIKWKDTDAPVVSLRELARNNFIVLRYADVLLMLSEATGDARYLNEVRDRAGMPRYGENGYPAEYPTLTDAIQHERQVELAMEFHRWFDLQRLGIAATVMKNCSKKVSSPIYLLPIPQKVIDQNPSVITQNDRYKQAGNPK